MGSLSEQVEQAKQVEAALKAIKSIGGDEDMLVSIVVAINTQEGQAWASPRRR